MLSSFSFSITLSTLAYRSNSTHCTKRIQNVFIHTTSIQLRLLHYNCRSSKADKDRRRRTIVNDDTPHAIPGNNFNANEKFSLSPMVSINNSDKGFMTAQETAAIKVSACFQSVNRPPRGTSERIYRSRPVPPFFSSPSFFLLPRCIYSGRATFYSLSSNHNIGCRP